MENAISSLFNRAVLDAVVGIVALAWIILVDSVVTNHNLVVDLLHSQYAAYSSVALLVGVFLLGNAVDKVSYLVLDHWLFVREFQLRRASFNLPTWCGAWIDQRVGEDVTVSPSVGSDLVDDSKADWISAFMLTRARSELLGKRADLIANYQFVSNLFIASLLFIPVAPVFVWVRLGYQILAFVAIPLLIAVALLYRAFAISSLRRVNTFENLVVFGLIVGDEDLTNRKGRSTPSRTRRRGR